MGSPPLARGKAKKFAIMMASREDHPRLRGEKIPRFRLIKWKVGSPPLARGKVCASSHDDAPQGITPACAGKSSRIGATSGERRDHPRLRGEKKKPTSISKPGLGSPPLARGKEKADVDFQAGVRITPACAGKSCSDYRCQRVD